MPSVKASELQPGQILVDPDGHLYEIVGVRDMTESGVSDDVYVWLWPDSASFPSSFQVFKADEEVNFIRGGVNSE